MVECTKKTINVFSVAAAATNNCEVEISESPTQVTDNITHERSSRRASRSSTGLEMSGLLLTWTIIQFNYSLKLLLCIERFGLSPTTFFFINKIMLNKFLL
ncbi:hypothetical protein KSP39_PZI002203 [Platanthera zijinensis]|uniref:Uncharacterized protein n=1 Tax=Platanthera zijinensis TaxID=2320716 RepID=A0AAP0GEK2_9ASPA